MINRAESPLEPAGSQAVNEIQDFQYWTPPAMAGNVVESLKGAVSMQLEGGEARLARSRGGLRCKDT